MGVAEAETGSAVAERAPARTAAAVVFVAWVAWAVKVAAWAAAEAAAGASVGAVGKRRLLRQQDWRGRSLGPC